MLSNPAKYLLLVLFLLPGIFIFVNSRHNHSLSVQTISPKKNPLAGDYNGDGKKEVISEVMKYEDMICISTVSFTDKNIEPKIDSGMFVSFIINEGDLDRISGDEFSIYWSNCDAGEWMGGVLYSIRDNKWKVHTSFSVYGNPDVHDYVYKDPANPENIIVEENYWKGDSMALRKESIKLY